MDERSTIDFRQIDAVPQLIKDYLDGKLGEFHNRSFSVEAAELQAEEKRLNFSADRRRRLTTVLSDQMQSAGLSGKQRQNLEALASSDTFSVTTGHQLNLFTGPVFFIYKILQTIKTADYLTDRLSGKTFVPVFWMATEDHDLDEIDHFRTVDDFYQMQAEAGGAVGRIKIEDTRFISDFEKEFAPTAHGDELASWMKEAYIKGISLTAATRILVQKLFAEYGLLVIDGDDARLKAEMIPVFEAELNNEELYRSTAVAVQELTERYGKVQVNPREINMFYLTDSRNRIERQNDKYVVVDTDKQFSQTEIIDELYKHPERFSPNAVLRPAFQETVLPDIAYIGGNAEIMYWLELKSYFDKIDLTFPILIPRNSLLFLSNKTLEKAKKLDLDFTDFFGDYNKLVNRKIYDKSPLAELLSEKKAEFQNIFAELQARAAETDPTFGNLVQAEEARGTKSFRRMEKRLLRAEKKVHADLLQRYNRLYEAVHPGGVWQERVYNFSVFYAFGGSDWLRRCMAGISVEKSQLAMLHN